MEAAQSNDLTIWKQPPRVWVAIVIVAAMLAVIFYDGLAQMVHKWSNSAEYGYGFLIPVITLFFIWQKKDQLELLPFPGSWIGFLLVFIGIGLLLLGELSTLYIIVQYAFLVVLYGLVLAFTGWRGIRAIWVPLLFLIFMIPLPQFLYQNLSAQLQLISSELGVSFIRFCAISVYLEGNVIDLGRYKLQVVEACSGLRYLFPLASLAFISAYIFKGAFWKKALIFISSLPITVFMNVLRIGMIGVLVEYYGTAMAQGFLHYFEGWVIFMACVAILVLEMWVLAKIGQDKRPLREVFGLEFPARPPKDAKIQRRTVPKSFWAAASVVAIAVVPASLIKERIEVVPPRAAFSSFPMTLADWQGRRDTLEDIYLEALKLSDYAMTNYRNDTGELVNFYVAYYASQSKGQSVHSPRSCIPGGGWQIKALAQRNIDGLTVNGAPLEVNRVVLQKGEYKQLVYYWFQQRGRTITNEYLVKWYLFWDALTKNRTDGALVRLATPVLASEDWEAGDARLADFSRALGGKLEKYIPN